MILKKDNYRYLNDVKYKKLVDAFVDAMIHKDFSKNEIIEAAHLAHQKYSEWCLEESYKAGGGE